MRGHSMVPASAVLALALAFNPTARPASAACTTDTTVADFAAGTPGACYLGETLDGEVLLAPTEGAEFSGLALPPGWGSFSWAPFGGATPNTVTVGGGSVAVEGSVVRTDANYGPGSGRSLEFVATFGSERFQHVGFGDIADSGSNQTYGQAPWAMFSTGTAGTQVQARVANGVSTLDVDVCATCQNTSHRYRIDWLPAQIDFYIDGALVQSFALTIAANMRPAMSDFNPVPSTAALVVDWARLTPYASPCTYDSAVIDSTTPASDWTTASLIAVEPVGTGVTVQTRSGPTPTPDGSWSSFQLLSGVAIQSPNDRYLQYRLALTSASPDLTPAAQAIQVCYTPCTPSTEVCDGADNDCDGQVDEGTSGAACDTLLPGICAAGTEQCQSGVLNCVQDTPQGTESCNGLDDDCDGQTDEGTSGAACVTVLPGICSPGTQQCQSGVLNCVQDTPQGSESCNGLDDDCDGQTDDGDPGGGGACSTELLGICAAGTLHCQSGSLACTQNASATIESCNGLDDNCNGATDEPFVDLGSSCTVGVGSCAQSGVKVCRGDGTGTICNATPGSPTPETCDGNDNDCDGLIDEGNPGSGGACSTGLPGVCGPGTLTCQGGGLVCVQNSQATAEVCNGVDDDCDGTTDDGDPGGGTTCNTGLPGACAPGVRHCIGGNVVCQPNQSSMPEICNNADDNCNNQIDEGNPGGGGACSTGQQGACDAGTLECQSGAFQCVQTTGPSTELCLGGQDEDCDGQSDELGDCVLCPAASTVASPSQTKKTKVRLTTTPDRDIVQATGTFILAAPYAISPDVEAVSLRVTDGAGFYFQTTVPAGNFVRASNGRRFSFSDPTLAFGGVRKAKFTLGGDGVTVKYSIKAQELNEPPFAAGTGSTTIEVGPRCFTDPADTCLVSSSSATCR